MPEALQREDCGRLPETARYVVHDIRRGLSKPLTKTDAWLNVAGTFPSSYGLTKFEAEGLVFMLQSGHPNLFVSLMLEEQRFLNALSQIEYRSKLVESEVSPNSHRPMFE